MVQGLADAHSHSHTIGIRWLVALGGNCRFFGRAGDSTQSSGRLGGRGGSFHCGRRWSALVGQTEYGWLSLMRLSRQRWQALSHPSLVTYS